MVDEGGTPQRNVKEVRLRKSNSGKPTKRLGFSSHGLLFIALHAAEHYMQPHVPLVVLLV